MTLGQAAILAAMLVCMAGCGSRVLNGQQLSDLENQADARDAQRQRDRFNSQLERRAALDNMAYAPIDESNETAPEQPRPANGVVSVSTRAPRIAQLRIITPPGRANFLFKLVDSATGATVITLFAAGGQTISTRVPLGTYRLRYASGPTWRGPQVLFGHHTNYSEFGNALTFSQDGDQISGVEIDMNIQVGGNLRENGVAPASF